MLLDYITTLGNFDAPYIRSGLYSNGYFDLYNVGSAEISNQASLALLRESRISLVDNDQGQGKIYDCIYAPGLGLLNSKKPLLPGCEIKLSFDRAKAELALIQIDKNTEVDLGTGVLKLTNLSVSARYFSSPKLRNYFAKISENPITYNYNECSVYLKNLPKGETNIRLNNIIGGLTPSHLFCGIIESDALNGDLTLSTTKFERHKVKEIDLTLNGQSLAGFPIQNSNGSALPAYLKWLKTTNREFNNSCSGQIEPFDFKRYHFIYGHKFEGEPTDQGWLGVDLKLDSAYDSNFTLGKLLIFSTSQIIQELNKIFSCLGQS